MIPYGRQDIQQADIDEVIAVLQSDFLTQGPVVPQFEQALAAYVDASFGVAMNSATSALHAACLALELGSGDWLWTTATTFVASANCGLYCGAQVDFVDIDPTTFNLSIDALTAKLATAERDGCLPKILVVVHLCGQPCDMQAIDSLAKRYKFRVIEDASHAVGAKYNLADDAYVGNCAYSDITIFSFHPVKIITTGEGGMAMTNQPELHERLQLFRSHGITRDAALFTDKSPAHGSWYYEQQELGFNYRMTELQAALGLSQLNRLSGYIEQRQAIATHYAEQFSGYPLQLQQGYKGVYSSYHLYVVCLQNKSAAQHKAIFEELREQGIGVNLHYTPVYLQPYYRKLGFREGYCPNAEAYAHSAISLPMFPTLTGAEQDTVITTLLQRL